MHEPGEPLGETAWFRARSAQNGPQAVQRITCIILSNGLSDEHLLKPLAPSTREMLHRKYCLSCFYWLLFSPTIIFCAIVEQEKNSKRTLKTPPMQESDGHDEIYSGRHLQIVEQQSEIHVSLSIWAAQLTTSDDHLALLYNKGVQEGVIDAVLQVLCTVTDLRLVDRAATFFDPEVLDMFDTCSTSRGRRRRRTQGEPLMAAVMSAWPEVSTMLRGSNDLLWSTWTMKFPLLRIGELYIVEAMMNNEGISLLEIDDAANEALEQVVQLAMDVNMMEREFDDILHRTVEEHILYAAPITQEKEMFTMAAFDYEKRFKFTARSIYPMRVCGVLMMFSSILIFVLLIISSRLRRIRIQKEAEAFQRDTPSIVQFRDSRGVEKLLEQSSPEALVHATASGQFFIPPMVGAKDTRAPSKNRYTKKSGEEPSKYSL